MFLFVWWVWFFCWLFFVVVLFLLCWYPLIFLFFFFIFFYTCGSVFHIHAINNLYMLTAWCLVRSWCTRWLLLASPAHLHSSLLPLLGSGLLFKTLIALRVLAGLCGSIPFTVSSSWKNQKFSSQASMSSEKPYEAYFGLGRKIYHMFPSQQRTPKYFSGSVSVLC